MNSPHLRSKTNLVFTTDRQWQVVPKQPPTIASFEVWFLDEQYRHMMNQHQWMLEYWDNLGKGYIVLNK